VDPLGFLSCFPLQQDAGIHDCDRCRRRRYSGERQYCRCVKHDGSRPKVKSRDETGRLLQALKDMNQSLVKIVGEVRTGTETIATASNEIASCNLDLSCLNAFGIQ
jgi:hypothetical protein